MILNKIEFLMMNNPIKRLIQKRYEFHKMGLTEIDLNGMSVLEIGCGSGFGTDLILRNCHPDLIQAIDLDRRMIDLARKTHSVPNVRFSVMDAAALDFPDGSFDVVIDFGIIHHIPNWRECISELRRVLRNGGRVFMEELTAESFQTLSGRVWKALLDHPYDQMFSEEQLINSLENSGFTVQWTNSLAPFNLLRHFNIAAIAR